MPTLWAWSRENLFGTILSGLWAFLGTLTALSEGFLMLGNRGWFQTLKKGPCDGAVF